MSDSVPCLHTGAVMTNLTRPVSVMLTQLELVYLFTFFSHVLCVNSIFWVRDQIIPATVITAHARIWCPLTIMT